MNKIKDGIKYPPAFLIKDGGTFALDVLVNQQTGVKIVDFVKISSAAKRASAPDSQLPTRDFSPVATELTVKNFRLLINEQSFLGAENSVREGISGTIIWIYLPGAGDSYSRSCRALNMGFRK